MTVMTGNTRRSGWAQSLAVWLTVLAVFFVGVRQVTGPASVWFFWSCLIAGAAASIGLALGHRFSGGYQAFVGAMRGTFLWPAAIVAVVMICSFTAIAISE
ncbi:hypothetical protein GCM10010435_87530 [Winogradskya consettensis]|uniref:Uncharacterized protein n=1 Tax=Winogradskya consettensis TaxID=113560 RepID=A0A919SZ19_9ACTN|nr:hypothetical protein [Actinoplanes consettensis]GIM80945.1 hypothetical protein Aco04nite_73810 [Actinoplanes consettensis]